MNTKQMIIQNRKKGFCVTIILIGLTLKHLPVFEAISTSDDWVSTDSKHYNLNFQYGAHIAFTLEGEQFKNPFSKKQEAIHIEFSATDGAINFYLFDTSNYELWKSNDPCCCLVFMERYDLTAGCSDLGKFVGRNDFF